MKKQICLMSLVFILTLGANSALAGKSSAELGREMFNDPKLGGSQNESSCNSCHAAGKGLENATAKKKFTKLVNGCLVDRMAGDKIDGRTVAMRSLKMYIRSLQEE